MRKLLPTFAGWLLIANHGVQLLTIAIATIGSIMIPVAIATLESHGIQQWTIYYGTATGLVEAVTLLALGTMLLRGHARARTILLWILPVVIAHDIGYTMLLGTPLLEAAPVFFALDAVAWLALLPHPASAKTHS
jgi:hypothetical protein